MQTTHSRKNKNEEEEVEVEAEKKHTKTQTQHKIRQRQNFGAVFIVSSLMIIIKKKKPKQFPCRTQCRVKNEKFNQERVENVFSIETRVIRFR